MTSAFSIAVHALVYLHHKNSTLSSEALAENICTNPARVRKIMAKLKKAGLVETRQGRQAGGYSFCQQAEGVTLSQVAQAVEAQFVSSPWRPGSKELPCLVASGMAGVMDGLYAELNGLCYDKLEERTIADVERLIFCL